MKIIIIGAGEVGFHLAKKLSEKNQDVVIIDKDPVKIKRINDELDVQSFEGSGTSPELLKDAGIERADMLITVTDSDEVNLISCLLGRNINPLMIKIARVRNKEYIAEKELFGKDLLGVDYVINPQAETVSSIMQLMQVPAASDVIDFKDGRIKLVGIIVKKENILCNKRLSEISFDINILIGSIIRGDNVIIPKGDSIIHEDDLIYIVLKYEQINSTLKALGIEDEPIKRVFIIGAGETGTELAMVLDKTKIHTKIIDNNLEKCSKLAEILSKVVVIHGNGSDRKLLQEENIEGADFLIALTGDEETNLIVSMMGNRLGVKKTITRVSKLSYISFVSAIGISSIVSPRISAFRSILQFIRKGKIISVAPLKGEYAEVIEAQALETSEIVNIPLADLKLPDGVLIGSIIRNNEIIIPRGNSVIMPNDHIIIFALQDASPKLEKLLTVKLEHF